MRNRKTFDWSYLKCIVLVFGGILSYLAYDVHVVKMGYEMSQMQKEKKQLERIHSELQIEISSLASLERIEHIATTQLGMIEVSPNDKIRVTELNNNERSGSVELAERELPKNILK